MRLSFDHLVSPAKECDREREAKRLGGLHVDDQLDFRDLLDREVGRFLALEDPAGVGADNTKVARKTASIAHQTAGRGELAILVDRGHRVAERQRGELLAPAIEE